MSWFKTEYLEYLYPEENEKVIVYGTEKNDDVFICPAIYEKEKFHLLNYKPKKEYSILKWKYFDDDCEPEDDNADFFA